MVVIYEQSAWSLIVREEKRLRVFDHRVVRRIFGPKRKRKAVTGDWRKLCSEQLHYFHSSPNKKDKMDRRCGSYEKDQIWLQSFDHKM
jgi:hypothetical protein